MAEFIGITQAGKCADCGVELDRGTAEELCAECQFHRKYKSPSETALLSSKENSVPPLATAEYVRPIGDYEILERIALGGMGVVYKARQLTLNRMVALKITSPAFLERFRREAQTAANLDHPNIVPVYELGHRDGQHFFSMRLVEGGTLAQALGSGPIPIRQGVKLVITIARAVHHAHQHGVLHRDLKPANILLNDAGTPYLIDFGLARLLDPEGQPRAEEPVGTPNYVAPEQASGDPSRLTTAADVYSIGVVLYEILGGRPPFRESTPEETIQRMLTEPPKPVRELNPAVDSDLEIICLKCLEKDPNRRYGSAEALAEDLERWLRHEPILARKSTVPKRLAKWTRRHPAVSLLLVALLWALATGMVSVFWQWRQAEQARRLAEQQKLSTEAALARVEQNLYFNHIALAEREWFANDLEKADQLLEECPPALRQWEWRYLKRLCHSESIRINPGIDVQTLAFSPDGQFLALPHLSPSESSPEGLYTVSLFNSRNAQKTLSLRETRAWISALAYSSDGKTLAVASGSGAQPYQIVLLDPHSGRERSVFSGHVEEILSVTFSPDDHRVASFSRDGMLHLWDASTGENLVTLKNIGSAVAFSPDGQQLIADAWEEFAVDVRRNHLGLKVLDPTTGKEISVLQALDPLISFHDVAFSPNGRFVAAASPDQTVVVWDAKTQEVLLTLQAAGTRIAFRPDGLGLATADPGQPVKLWELPSGRQLGTLRGALRCAAFSPDGQRVAAPSLHGTVKIWNVTAASEAQELTGTLSATLNRLDISPDGKRVAVANDGWEAAPGGDSSQAADFGGISVADLTKRGIALRLKRTDNQQAIRDVAFSPDGQRLAAVASWNGAPDDPECEISLWDADTGAQLASARHPPGQRLVALTFSPDGQRLAVGGHERSLQICAAETLEPMLEVPTRGLCLAFSPDGHRLATASGPFAENLGEVQIWNLQAGELQLTLRPADRRGSEYITAVAFSPGGDRLAAATGDDTDQGAILVWNLDSSKPMQRIMGHGREVTSVAFAPDGRRLASGSYDQTVKLWDLNSGQAVLTLRSHTSPVLDVGFGYGGNMLISLSSAGVRIWDATFPPSGLR
jgi:WD40 repeat protein/serine/threonine protein kinase